MKILVTGAAGYIGAILVPELIKNHKVIAFDNYQSPHFSLGHVAANPNFTAVKGDVRDQRLMKSLLADSDFVIPLAALVGAPLCDLNTNDARTINYEAIKWLVENTSSDQRIIYPNTNSGYGTTSSDEECTEETPLRPISLYGATKTDAEKSVLDSGKGTTFRLATVFGASPRMRLDLMVNDFVYRALKDRSLLIFEGSFKRNFIHVRDVAAAFIHAIANHEIMRGEAYNVGLSSANLTKIELCALIKKHIKGFTFMEAPYAEDKDKRNYIVSNAKIEASGFVPKYDLDHGIIELVKAYEMLSNKLHSNV